MLTMTLNRLARGQQGEGFVPPLDAVETPDALILRLDVPGVDPATIDVSYEKDTLEIRGSRGAEKVPEDARWHAFERGWGEFRRTLRLRVPVDAAKIEATCENGVLTLHLPKPAAVLPRKIEVKTH